MLKSVIIGAAMIAASTPAYSAVVVDGTRDASYGTIDAKVDGDPNAPTSNFGDPSNTATNPYNISTVRDGDFVYGFLQTKSADALPFANLYFDLDAATRSGSDLGFELSANNGASAFIPGVDGKVTLSGITTAFVAGQGFEFSIPTSYFSSKIAGLNYNPALTFSGSARLNLSQSFNYSVAGGTGYGVNRLGVVDVAAAVPEPATWAMLLIGFGMMGGAMRYRRKRTDVSYA